MSTKCRLNYLKEFIPADSMHLSVYLPDVQMLRFVAIAGLEDAIPVPDINWEAPENQRDGMPDVHLMNNGWEEPKILDLLEQANINPDFSVMVMRLSLDQRYVGQVAVRSRGIDRFTEEHGRLLVLLRDPLAIALADALKHLEVVRPNEVPADDSRYFQQELRAEKGGESVDGFAKTAQPPLGTL